MKKTLKQLREEKHQRYGAIDRHNDFVDAGYTTPHKPPFVKRVTIALTEKAQAILKQSEDKQK